MPDYNHFGAYEKEGSLSVPRLQETAEKGLN